MAIRIGRRALAGAAAAFIAGPAAAQGWAPSRPVRMIVPFPPGGGSDILGRLLVQRIGDGLGQPFVVENRGGAGGNIGAEATARAPADGHAVMIAANTFVLNAHLYRSLPFDVRRDFAPVARVAVTPMVLAAGPRLAARTLAETVAELRARPAGAINHGTAGLGTVTHLASELFDARLGTRMTQVHYRGTGPMITALISGEVELAFTPLPSVAAQVADGRLRLLAVASAARMPAHPAVPTIAEGAGLPGFEADIWFGMLAPAGTPAPAVARLAEAFRVAVQDGDAPAALTARGFDPAYAGPAELARIIAEEYDRWGEVVRRANITVE
jgi:tripartite-type tricarboxylate transporter receptor subunit TctC